MSPVLQIRRSAVLLALGGVFVLGGVLGLFIPAWAGYSLSGTSELVPMFVARRDARAGDGSAAGFAAVVKPVLPAVVNISSSKVVRTQNVPLARFSMIRSFGSFSANNSGISSKYRESSARRASGLE
jgi:S1-C subfamily serine protease